MVKVLSLTLEEMTSAIVSGLIIENKLTPGNGRNINIEFNACKDADTGELELTGCTLNITD